MFGSDNKFDPNKDIPDLSGKVYVVTGGSAGIGFGICAHLLQHNPAALYLLGKKEEHIQEAEEGLKKFGDTSKIHSVQIELEDLKQTDQAAKELASKLDRLDGLICNAGLGVGPYHLSKDGIDSHMQVNHIAQFHLTQILLPLLQKTPHSRLVLQSSDLHRGISSVKFESIDELNQDIGPMKLYARTKLAQVLYIRALAERKEKGLLGFDQSPEVGPWMNASHPGGVRTDQQKQAVEAYGTLGKIGVAAVRPLLKDPVDEGCRPALFAAASEDVQKDRVQGQYIVPDRKINTPSSEARDHELQENLWRLTEKILVEKLGSVPYTVEYAS
ncbi:NAD(P)-binding protein [Myriangium duriaei CBS 260.36]|uniref:NAD(P)-binding protein n=1 Tax=Myriangium duriaei CBS 260.36 TaxID=1168546 RepID=A0A9P4MLS8_9PEZI|nr:NAD(P)-binding protein [Myriangium duriaei CBS 260.36]